MRCSWGETPSLSRSHSSEPLSEGWALCLLNSVSQYESFSYLRVSFSATSDVVIEANSCLRRVCVISFDISMCL